MSNKKWKMGRESLNFKGNVFLVGIDWQVSKGQLKNMYLFYFIQFSTEHNFEILSE